ncbi:MAG TPA: redoxin domain-containing protein [Chloroflexia bacterium]|nr:redoxin domain-containing protein [Chloroflexia bacterium]
MTGNTGSAVRGELHDEGQLRAYLDGELPRLEAARVEVHLESCAECRERLEEIRTGAIEVSGLLGMPVHTPDPHVALSGLRQALGEEAVGLNPVTEGAAQALPASSAWSRERAHDSSGWRWSRLARSGVGVMLAAAVVLGLGLFWSGLPGRVLIKPPVLGIPGSIEATSTAQAGEAAGVAVTPQNELETARRLIGLPAPDADLLDLSNGQTVKLSAFKGRAVVLTFWETSCASCRAILQTLQETRDSLGPAGDVEFLSVTFSHANRDTPERVREFLKDKPYTWRFLHDTTGDASQQYKVTAFPMTFVIDKSGIVRDVRVGTGDGLADLLVDSLTSMSGAADRTPGTRDRIADFVPAGKVRHIVVTLRNESDVPTDPTRIVSRDIWFANGDNHLLMRYTADQTDWSLVPVEPGISVYGAAPREVWLTDDALYVHKTGEPGPSPAANVVLKYPYDPDYLTTYGPNPDALADLQKRYPEAQVVENTVLDGHPVVKVLHRAGTGQAPAAGTPGSNSQSPFARTTTYWIDTETGQYRRVEVVTQAEAAQGNAMQTFTGTLRIERDEVLGAEQAAPGYFEFKLPEGATFIERERKVISFGMEEGAGGWSEHLDVLGNFSVLMPRTPDYSFDGYGQTTLGAKEGSVTYGVKYSTLATGPLTPADPALLERTFELARAEGRVLSQQDITLGAYPGREYRLTDANGNYRIWRVYVAGQRVYTVFAIAPDEATEAETIRDFFASFHLLNP